MATERWTTPKRLFAGDFPFITWDGKSIYYSGPGGIQYRNKVDTGWSAPVVLSTNINHHYQQSEMCLSHDKKTFYYTAGNGGKIYRSFWIDSLNDWTYSALLNDNGINGLWNWWAVECFIDDSTMILVQGSMGKISHFNYNTGLWDPH